MILLDASHVLQRIEEVPQWIEVGGQIAAIIICLFSLIFVLLTLAFNLVMGFGLTWVREKAELIKKLRPEVEHVNNACKTSLQGEPLPEQENAVIKAVAAVPPAVHAADQRVEQVSGRVVNAIIEVQARAVQIRTVVKAFLLPGLLLRERQRVSEAVVLPTQEPPVSEPEKTAGGGAGRERAPEQPVEKKVEAVAAGQR